MQDDEITRTKKAFFLGMIVRKLVSVFHGIEAPDDRDDNANKRLDGPGPLLAILFRQLYRNTLKHTKAQLEKVRL
jgi:DNA-directed RNA polymerase beta subunit